MLDKMTRYKGKGLVQMTGRQMGKSTFGGQAFQRLWDDIKNSPIQDLKLSEGKVYGSRYYCVEPVGGSWLRMETWCLDTFGSNGSVWDKDKAPKPNARWYMNDRRFWFREEKDRMMFVLKWR
jgi:hypothetical protein